ncbi:unnamed protein product [Sphagnum jensenii]|uniref:Uncharacterized protein n=1 Tax=Sphagnum jensenii TaxID=128206 RepID=A0ABP1B0U0_9BRYO
MWSKTRESSKGTTTISIDKRKANIEKSNESDLRYVADQDWGYVISGHGLVGRCPSRVIRHSHKRLIQRPVAGGTRRQCPKASRRLLRNCFFFFFSLSIIIIIDSRKGEHDEPQLQQQQQQKNHLIKGVGRQNKLVKSATTTTRSSSTNGCIVVYVQIACTSRR